MTHRDTFDSTKRYLGGPDHADDREWLYLDWDANERRDHLAWFLLLITALVAGGSGRMASGLAVSALGSPGADVLVSAGSAVVGGRPVQLDDTVRYGDGDANYIERGTLSTLEEIVPGVSYKITDSLRSWTSGHSLVGCRVRFDSGALDGSVFEITNRTGQQLVLAGDLSTAAAGDSYTIQPPAFTVGADGELYLVTWMSNITSEEDTDLVDPSAGISPSDRRQLRWCLHLDWAGTPSSELLSGHTATLLAVLDLSANTTVVAEDITQADGLPTLASAKSDLTAIEADVADALADVELFGASVQAIAIHDFRPSTTEPMLWVTEVGSALIEFNPTHTWGSPFSSLDTANPYRVVGGRTAPVSSLTNTTVQSSYLSLSLATDETGQNGTLDGTMIQSTDDEIPLQNLAVLAIHANAATSVVERSLPLGYEVRKIGLDWIIFADGPNYKVRISPGQIWDGGLLLQNPLQFEVQDSSDAAWHVEGAVPTESWCYLYAIQTAADERSLTFQWSVAPPRWNSEHPSVRGWCIGVTYFDASGIPKFGYQRGEMFWFERSDEVILHAVEVDAPGTPGEMIMALQPPRGPVELHIEVSAFAATASEVTARIYPYHTGGTLFERGTYVGVSSNLRSTEILPGSTGEARLWVGGTGIVGDYAATLMGYRFQFGWTPDADMWED